MSPEHPIMPISFIIISPLFPGWRRQDLNVRNGVLFGCDRKLHPGLFIEYLKAALKMTSPPLSVSLDCCSALMWPAGNNFISPLLLVSMQWGCLVHQASIQELFICVSTQRRGTNILNRLVIMAGLLFGRKPSDCWLQRLTDSYLREGSQLSVK